MLSYSIHLLGLLLESVSCQLIEQQGRDFLAVLRRDGNPFVRVGTGWGVDSGGERPAVDTDVGGAVNRVKTPFI